MIRFAATIFTSSTWQYRALCGYESTDAKQFSNERGEVLKRQGGRVTCPECLARIGVKT